MIIILAVSTLSKTDVKLRDEKNVILIHVVTTYMKARAATVGHNMDNLVHEDVRSGLLGKHLLWFCVTQS